MKQPIFLKYVSYYNEVLTPHDLIHCCDSEFAVMDQKDIDEWLVIFDQVSSREDASEYCDSYTTTMVFEIEDKKLVCVSDSGGDLCAGVFGEFCENKGIKHQFIIDGFDYEYYSIDDMYSGQVDDDPELMRLIHQITN